MTTPAAVAGSASWAHQAGSSISNGAVTIKSLSGGSYAATQNPTGAIAKANQVAATQPPTVIIQATASSSLAVAVTKGYYTGNLGGVVGANAICSNEFGSGWKFASLGHFYVADSLVNKAAWVDNENAATNCVGWTKGDVASAGHILGVSSAMFTVGSQTCNSSFQIACSNF